MQSFLMFIFNSLIIRITAYTTVSKNNLSPLFQWTIIIFIPTAWKEYDGNKDGCNKLLPIPNLDYF